jgi:hypothetical protein
MNYAYIRFFNIQYWYCVIISLFGNHCTYTDLGTVSAVPLAGQAAQAGNVATTTAQAAGPVAHPGFWDWLFGITNAPEASSATASSAPPGIFGTILIFIVGTLGFLWALYSVLAYFVSFLLLLLIIVSLAGIFIIRMEDEARYGNLSPEAAKLHPRLGRWQALLDNAMTSDPKRWRESILGADMLLGELFTTIGYVGATTDEQIRGVSDDAFANLPAAWEAHRIRNFISSPSSHFILTQREAFRVMKLYEQVFREFDFI